MTVYPISKPTSYRTIVEQTESTYDTAGNAILVTVRHRFHNATGTGELTSPDGSQPKARVTYVAQYCDEIARPVATADYGTNGGSAPTRPDAVPQRSDTILVTSTEYNDDGEAYKTINPAGREDRGEFDDLGRVLKTIQNYQDGVVDEDYPDQDVTVETTYNADGKVATLTAKNPTTGDQATQYVYGTTLDDSGVARADLLRAEIYPDSDDTADPLDDGADEVYDRVEYKYNRQGQLIERKDQNQTVHAFEYDDLGRPTADKVTSVGSGVDDAVLRIARAYEVRGMVEKLTSYDAATSGNAVNEVVFDYDDAALLAKEYEEHAGAKDGSTLYVQYNRDTSASSGVFTKGLRPTSVRYPNGRLLHTTYGSSGSTADALNRIAAINDDQSGQPGDSLAEYAYLGAGTIAQADYPQPELRFDLAHGSGNDPYDGPLDRFGRVTDLLWRDYGSSSDAVRIGHEYDRAGNRTSRTNELNHDFDESYQYDAIDRLVSAARDNGFDQSWDLDPLGNFSEFDDDGDSQTRTANAANEITGITGGWISPAYDAAGNLISGPKPGDETTRVHYVYDAWNRLAEVRADDSGEPGELVARYAYDGQNRRITKTLPDDSGTEFFYNEAWQLLEERHFNASAQLVSTDQYVWGLGYIDSPVARFHDDVFQVDSGQKILASEGAAGDQFGYSVAISGDYAIVGADLDDDRGSAYVFVRSGTTWTQQAKLTASDGADGDHFGYSVAISGDTAVVGAWGDDDDAGNSGSAYIFVRSGTTWTQQAKLKASDGAEWDAFGSVAISADTVIVGATGGGDGGSQSGAAYVFVRSGTTWSQQAKLTASDGAYSDGFGCSVAISGDSVIVGAGFDDDGGSDSGSAYIFVRSGTSWSQQAKLTASDAGAFDHFGLSVAISGDTVIVGASSGGDGGSESGAAYVFVRSGTSWSQQAKLTASDGAYQDFFGISVAICGDTVIAGAHGDDDSGNWSGSAYLFLRSGTSWCEEAKLTAADAAAEDWFGRPVAISSGNAIVGSHKDDDNGTDSGSAYLFPFSTTAGDNVRYYLSDANHNVAALADGLSGEVVERYVYDAYGRATVYSPTWTDPASPPLTPPSTAATTSTPKPPSTKSATATTTQTSARSYREIRST